MVSCRHERKTAPPVAIDSSPTATGRSTALPVADAASPHVRRAGPPSDHQVTRRVGSVPSSAPDEAAPSLICSPSRACSAELSSSHTDESRSCVRGRASQSTWRDRALRAPPAGSSTTRETVQVRALGSARAPSAGRIPRAGSVNGAASSFRGAGRVFAASAPGSAGIHLSATASGTPRGTCS